MKFIERTTFAVLLLLLFVAALPADQLYDSSVVRENAARLVDLVGGGDGIKAELVQQAVDNYEMREDFLTQIRALVPEKRHVSPADGGELKAGVGVRVITPPKGCPLAGYGDRIKMVPFSYHPLKDPFYYSKLYKPNIGAHDDLTAKALVLDNGEKRVAILAVDAIGVTQLIYETVLSRVAYLGIDRDGLIVCGSHTHSGNGDAADMFFWNLVTVDMFDHRIFDPMIDNLVGAVEDAVADLEPARLGVGSDDEDHHISHNRRGDDILDTEIGVVRVDHLDGSPKVVLFNFAIHGTILGGDNMLFSGDNMGCAERYIESELPGVTAIFTNGAEGDVSPSAPYGDDEWEEIEAIGQVMGDAVLDIRGGIVTETDIVLDGAHIFVDMPDPYFRPAMFQEGLEWLYWFTISLDGLVEQDNTNFNGLRIGPALFVTAPGEPITSIGLDVKNYAESFGFDEAFVVGLADGHLGYITTEEEYWEGGYESGATLHGPETGSVVTEACYDIVDMLTSDE